MWSEDLHWNVFLFFYLVGVAGATSCPVEVMEQVISKLNVTQLTVKLISVTSVSEVCKGIHHKIIIS